MAPIFHILPCLVGHAERTDWFAQKAPAPDEQTLFCFGFQNPIIHTRKKIRERIGQLLVPLFGVPIFPSLAQLAKVRIGFLQPYILQLPS